MSRAAYRIAASGGIDALHQSAKHQTTVHGYFQTAHQASGETSAQTSSQGTDQLPAD